MAYELLDQILSTAKVDKVKKQLKESAKKEETVVKLNEFALLDRDLTTVVEASMKDTVKSIINESTTNPDLRSRQLNAVETVSFKPEQVNEFMESVIDPIIETVGSFNKPKFIKTKNNSKMRQVFLPVYEIALTLESARLNALTYESLNDVPVKEDVDPNQQELEDVVNKNNNKIENGTYGTGSDTTEDASNLDLPSPEIPVTSSEAQTVIESDENDSISDSQLLDVDQYEDNDVNSIGAGRGQNDVEVPDSLDDLFTYEGEPVDPSQTNDAITQSGILNVRENVNSTILRNLVKSLNENMIDDVTNDNVIDQTSVESLKTYEGEPAGEGAPLSDNDLAADGTSDEAIIEGQLYIASFLLGRIFREYGIDRKDVKKAMVREAVHYLSNYGMSSLYPCVGDVSSLVIEQNKLSETNSDVPSAKVIVEHTKPVLSKKQVKLVEAKSKELISALKIAQRRINILESATAEDMKPGSVAMEKLPSNDKTKFEAARDDAESIVEAVGVIVKSSDIERSRQAFRYRMNKFTNESKHAVATKWVFKENNTTKAAKAIAQHITSRSYVTEGPALKEYCKVLKEDSPIFNTNFAKPKNARTNDNLISAAIVTEFACLWGNIRKNHYNKKSSLREKYLALNEGVKLASRYKRFAEISDIKDVSKPVNILENAIYRLESLKGKTEILLKNKKK